MARSFGLLELLFILVSLAILLENGADGITVRHPTHVRLEALQGRKCLNLLFNEPCVNNPYCNISLNIRQERQISRSSLTSTTMPFQRVTKLNGSYILCIYDSYSALENVSCCNDIRGNSGVAITSGRSVDFRYDKISFDLRACVNDSDDCLTIRPFYKTVFPWYNPCFFDRPCKNLGSCIPFVNSYNCSCRGEWKGANCTVPKDMTYHAGKCLDYSSNTDIKLYMKTLAECKTACSRQYVPRCKSFQFKKITANHGNCTLRDSNTKKYKVVPCDMDLYEFTSLLTPNRSGGVTVTIVTFQLLLLSLFSFFL